MLNRQRTVIYAERRQVLEGADLTSRSATVDDLVEGYVAAATGEGFPEEWDLDLRSGPRSRPLPGVGDVEEPRGGVRRRLVRAHAGVPVGGG